MWNWTRSGEFSVQPCPGGATGVARWRCLPGPPPHRPPTPDLSECRSVWLTSLDSRISDGDAVISIVTDLSQVTDSKTLYGGDMMTTTQIMKKLAKKMTLDIQTYPDQRQREAIVTELLHGVLRTGSNLLDVSQLASWRDLTHKEQMRVATSLLVGIEENSFLLADTVVRKKNVTRQERNILLTIRVLETSNIDHEVFSFGSGEGEARNWTGADNWLRLERKALLENRSEGNLLRVVYVAFDRLETILVPAAGRANTSRLVNSKVISASLGKGRHIQLSQPVTICLKHIHTENVTNPTCVFWDYTMSAWSEEGCKVQETNFTHTTCSCDHLTNFAILMDVQATYLPPGHQMALQIITYIGCIVSIICLFFAILTFQLFRGLKSDRTTIHKNLCFCLLVAEVLFIAGVGQTDFSLLCGIVAGLLHYFFLCAFAWMFLEGFQLYVMLIEVFEVEKSRIRWYYLFAYGVPLLIVIISCAIDRSSYGTDRYCWLRADNFFILSFVIPVVAVILANLVFLSMAIYMMCRHANTGSVKTKEQSRLASARVWLRGAIVLVVVLGLTWTFGLLYLNEESVIWAYVFTVLNSGQGLFIFIFHCLLNEKAQKEYRKVVRRYGWLSSCAGKESPASGSGTSGSGGESKERRTSLYTSGMTAAPSTESTSSGPHHHPTYYQQTWGLSKPVETAECAATAADVATLPYPRSLPRPSALPPPHPASSTTWAPAHKPFIWKQNISLKSFNRENGQEEVEPEDIRSNSVLGTNSLRHKERQGYGGVSYGAGYGTGPGSATLQHRSKQRSNGSAAGRATSPWNHTYTEIRGEGRRDDPVYEEIERERADVPASDASDEDQRRQSDMSRQSSRSYGDHRPLIPYSPAAAGQPYDRSFHTAFDAAFRQRLREQTRASQGTVAVLDGQTVVCHLQPDYTSRTILHHQPYSEC